MSKEEINIFEIYVELFNCRKIKCEFIKEQKYEKASEYRDLEKEIHNKLGKFVDWEGKYPDIEKYFLKYNIDLKYDMSVVEVIREVKLYHLLN